MFTEDAFILNAPNRIRVSAKRYIPKTGGEAQRNARITLLLAHALGFNKEHWEPTIQELFQEDHASGGAIIKEAWAVDCPDHGESAALNDAELDNGRRFISCYEYGDAFLTLIRSGLIDQGTHLVFIGHSAGTFSGILSTARYHHHNEFSPYSAMILIEPTMISRNLWIKDADIRRAVGQLSKSSGLRHDIWPSAADARSWLLQRSPWKSWDPRVLDAYVDFGMRPLPTPIYPDINVGVTLSFPRMAHSMAYGNLEDQHDALDRLTLLCNSSCRIHVIFGDRIDYSPQIVRDEILSIVTRNPFGDVTYVKDAGHMVIQQRPAQVAKAISRTLHLDYGSFPGKL